MRFAFEAEIWRSPGPGGWHFASLPQDVAHGLRVMAGQGAGQGGGPSAKSGASAFGSIRVTAKIGTSRWKTSVFPDSKSGTFFLPVKAAVRAREALGAGDRAGIALTLDL